MRLLFISLLVFAAFTVSAQIRLKEGQTSAHYTGLASDTVSGTNSLSKTIYINKDYWYNYNITVDIDTLLDASDASISCVLAGSDDNTNYTTITDVTYGVSADTIIYYSNTTVATEAQTIAQHTITTTAYTILDTVTAFTILDTLSAFNVTTIDSLLYDDTLHYAAQYTESNVPAQYTESNVPAITNTVAAQTITNTVTAGGKMWNWLKLTLTGDGATAYVELQAIRVKIARVPKY